MTRVALEPSGVPARVLAIVGVALAGAVLGAAVAAAAYAAGLRPWRYPGLSPLVTVPYAVVGTLLGAVAWHLVRRRARRPRTVLGWSVGAVTVVSLGSDVVAGLDGRLLVGLASAAQHVVVIGATVAVLRWAMPVPPSSGPRDVPPGWASGLRRPVRVLLAIVLVVAAAVWVVVNKAVEGPTLLVLTSRHGLTWPTCSRWRRCSRRGTWCARSGADSGRAGPGPILSSRRRVGRVPVGNSAAMPPTDTPHPLVLTLGDRELVIRRRYQALSIVNDILVAIWFLVGSIMFFSESWTYTGTWFFVVGSVELMIRPIIRLARQVHLQRLPGARAGTESEHDF